MDGASLIQTIASVEAAYTKKVLKNAQYWRPFHVKRSATAPVKGQMINGEAS